MGPGCSCWACPFSYGSVGTRWVSLREPNRLARDPKDQTAANIKKLQAELESIQKSIQKKLDESSAKMQEEMAAILAKFEQAQQQATMKLAAQEKLQAEFKEKLHEAEKAKEPTTADKQKQEESEKAQEKAQKDLEKKADDAQVKGDGMLISPPWSC